MTYCYLLSALNTLSQNSGRNEPTLGKLSDYTLNLDKTEALLLKGPALYPSKWQTDSLLYLGVHITKHPSKLYNINPFLRNLELTLHTWKNFTLYLGRVNLIKIVEFPKLLSHMHSLLI